jgi:hypothetical protein
MSKRGIYRGFERSPDGLEPDLTFRLETDFYTTEPQQVPVSVVGPVELGRAGPIEFRATTDRPRIEVEVACETTGIMHALWQVIIGPGLPFSLHGGTVSGGVVGTTTHDIGKVAGEYGQGQIAATIWPDDVHEGQIVRCQVFTGVVGYAALVSGLTVGNVAVRVMPNNKKLYVLHGAAITPIILGRTLENHANATIAGEYIPAVPYVTGGAADVVFKSDSSRAYVSDWFGAVPQVVVVDTLTDRVLTVIPGFSPIGMAITDDDSKVFVCTGAGANAIKIINTTTHAVTTQSLASTSVVSAQCEISPDGTKLAVATGGGSGVTNRVYVYTVGTGGTTWTLLATCVVGGADSFPGPIAWEGNNVVWAPYETLNAVYRCQVDTQGVSSFAFTGANCVAVTGSGLGKSLFVTSATNTDRMAYYVLPSSSAVAPTKYDNANLFDMYSVQLSSDDFIYQGTDDGQVYINQGGQIWCRPNSGFWGEGVTVRVFGGEPV